MMPQQLISSHIEQSIHTKQAILNDSALLASILSAATACKNALAEGRKILLAGNGGSAADAQHIAAEWVGRFEKERTSFAAIALTTDTSALTAIANDYGYEQVFARQVQGLGQMGDVFIAISTSGNSTNLIEAIATAKSKGLITIALVGEGGKMPSLCDYAIRIPCHRTATIPESHIMIGHLLCALVDHDS